MEYRQLGGSGLKVSALSFGTAKFGGGNQFSVLEFRIISGGLVGAPSPAVSRLHVIADKGPPVIDEHLYRVIDAMEAIAKETNKTVPQIALNWLLQRPSVSSVIIGRATTSNRARIQSAIGWTLNADQLAYLDQASATTLAYPYWHQHDFAERNPPPVGQNVAADGQCDVGAEAYQERILAGKKIVFLPIILGCNPDWTLDDQLGTQRSFPSIVVCAVRDLLRGIGKSWPSQCQRSHKSLRVKGLWR